MPAFLPKVTDAVRERLRASLDTVHPDHRELMQRLAASPLLSEIGQMFIETVGLAIDNEGEIYNPAPLPGRQEQYQTGVHWTGGKKPRGKR